MESHLYDRKLLTIEDVQQVLSIGRTKVFTLIASGELKSIRIGSSRRITSDALGEFINRLVKESESVSNDETERVSDSS